MSDFAKHDLIRWLRAETLRATGRDYRVAWEAFDLASLREVQRFVRDLEDDAARRERRARVEPWRR